MFAAEKEVVTTSHTETQREKVSWCFMLCQPVWLYHGDIYTERERECVCVCVCAHVVHTHIYVFMWGD